MLAKSSAQTFVSCGYIPKANDKESTNKVWKDNFSRWLVGLSEEETITLLCTLVRKNAYKDFYYCYYHGCCLTDKVVQAIYNACLEKDRQPLVKWLYASRLVGESSYSEFDSRLVRWARSAKLWNSDRVPDSWTFFAHLEEALEKTDSDECIRIAVLHGDVDILAWALHMLSAEVIKNAALWMLGKPDVYFANNYHGKEYENFRLDAAEMLCWSVLGTDSTKDKNICRLGMLTGYEQLTTTLEYRGFAVCN